MRKIRFIAICMVIIFMFVGCGNASDESKPTSIDDMNKKNQSESDDEKKDDYLSTRMSLLSLKNGENISVAVAVDGCGIWHSDGIYYDYGSEKARDVFALFGLSWDDLD